MARQNYLMLTIMWFPIIYAIVYVVLSWNTQFSVFLPVMLQDLIIPPSWKHMTPYEVLYENSFNFTAMIGVITVFFVGLWRVKS